MGVRSLIAGIAVWMALAPCSYPQNVVIHAGQPPGTGLNAPFGLPPVMPIPPLGLTTPPGRAHRFQQRGAFPTPFFWGSYYPYAEPYQPPPGVVVVVPEAQAAPAPPPSPPQPVRPEIHEYQHPEQAGRENATFEIVGRDGAVTHAIAVWVEGEAVHFITPDGGGGALPLASVDRPATQNVNAQKGLTLRLPAPSVPRG
jgi:hypothetical protein